MKKMWIIPTIPEKIGSHKALKHKVTKELGLFGKYGEIWLAGVDKIGVMVTSSRLAKKELSQSGIFGDQFVIKTNLTNLNKWVKIIKVPKSLAKQLKLAE